MAMGRGRTADASTAKGGSPGVAQDPWGGPVVDPTLNVLRDIAALKEWTSIIREGERRYYDSEVAHVKEMAALRALYGDRSAELERSRTDSIRQVDQLNASTAAERVLAAVNVLNIQTTTNAQTLRDLVSSTAMTLATQTDKKFSDITERIVAMERSLSRGEGKDVVGDPALGRLASRVEELFKSGERATGKTAGISAVWVVGVAAVGLVSTLLSIAAAVYVVLKP